MEWSIIYILALSHFSKCDETCPDNYFLCSDETQSKDICIPTNGICDGVPICHDGSDEQNCTSLSCKGFWCESTKECFAIEYECNGNIDCLDESDEEDCLTCRNGYVISNELHCDGYRDCSDTSDEENCNFFDQIINSTSLDGDSEDFLQLCPRAHPYAYLHGTVCLRFPNLNISAKSIEEWQGSSSFTRCPGNRCEDCKY